MRKLSRYAVATLLVVTSGISALVLPFNMPTNFLGHASVLGFWAIAGLCGLGIATGIIMAITDKASK